MDARAISSLSTVRIPVASVILIPMECVYKFVWQMVAGAEAHCESKLAAEILAEEAWFCVCTLGKNSLGTCLFGFFWQLSICYFAEEHSEHVR